MPSEAETWILLASLVFDNRTTWRDQVAERTGMPFSRFRALRRLEHRPMTSSILAERLDIDTAATSVIVSDLVARGLVAKQDDPDDGRRKILSLTKDGVAVMDAVRAIEHPSPLLAALTDDERATLHSLLTKMQEHSA